MASRRDLNTALLAAVEAGDAARVAASVAAGADVEAAAAHDDSD
jgi:hypothetical protein